jgi:hypothetical protein
LHQVGAGFLEGNPGGAGGLEVVAPVVGPVCPGGHLAPEPLLGGLGAAEVLLEVGEVAVGIGKRLGIGQGLEEVGFVGVEGHGLQVPGGDRDLPGLFRHEHRVGMDRDPAPAELVEAFFGVTGVFGPGVLPDQLFVELPGQEELVPALQNARGGSQGAVQVGALGVVAGDALDQLERIQPGFGYEYVRQAYRVPVLSVFIAFLLALLSLLLPFDRRHFRKPHEKNRLLVPGLDDQLGALFLFGLSVDFLQQEYHLGALGPGEVVLGVLFGRLNVLFGPESVPKPPAAGLQGLDQGQVVFHGLLEEIPVRFGPGLLVGRLRQ